MKNANRELVIDALTELADVNTQRDFWINGRGGQSALAEAVETLFTDSGLSELLEDGVIAFSPIIDQKLKLLDVLVAEVPGTHSPSEVVNDERMLPIRELSRELLNLISPP